VWAGSADEPRYRISASHTDQTVTVYQAYSPRIAGPAARTASFPESWKRDRMTWIKPSFLWMVYRCGRATKPDQETVLAVEMTCDGFEWALRRSCPSHYDARVHPDEVTWKPQLRRSPARARTRDPRLRTCR
jgi:hypothetical protein